MHLRLCSRLSCLAAVVVDVGCWVETIYCKFLYNVVRQFLAHDFLLVLAIIVVVCSHKLADCK
jgi:hypothetical protein